MAIGFKIPSGNTKDMGLWEVTSDAGSVRCSISDTGIACIVFFVLILGSLIAGFVVHQKDQLETNKFIKISTISIFSLFGLALILALAGKVSSTVTSNSGLISIWFKLNMTKMRIEYTAGAITVVIILSLGIVLPTVYTILGLIKIPYKS